MSRLIEFDCVSMGLFSLDLASVTNVVREILDEKSWEERFELGSGPLDLDAIYVRRPQPGGRLPLRCVLFEPKSSPDTTVFIANREDGWHSFVHILASRLAGSHLFIRSDIGPEYPVAAFEMWRDGSSVRYVRAMREDPQWEFFERGNAQSFEEPSHYKRRRIVDRLNRDILVSYARNAGWDLCNPGLWESALEATYLRETRAPA